MIPILFNVAGSVGLISKARRKCFVASAKIALSRENQRKITLNHVVFRIDFDGATQVLLGLGQIATLRHRTCRHESRPYSKDARQARGSIVSPYHAKSRSVSKSKHPIRKARTEESLIKRAGAKRTNDPISRRPPEAGKHRSQKYRPNHAR